MNDSVLEKFTGRKHDAPVTPQSSEDVDATEDYGGFGWLRGVRDRAIMLEFRKKDGNIKAVGLAWLQQAEFDPSIGITLLFAGQKIRILGRNLNAETRPSVRLFSGILRHRVPWIQEADTSLQMRTKEHETIIERIEWS